MTADVIGESISHVEGPETWPMKSSGRGGNQSPMDANSSTGLSHMIVDATVEGGLGSFSILGLVGLPAEMLFRPPRRVAR